MRTTPSTECEIDERENEQCVWERWRKDDVVQYLREDKNRRTNINELNLN